MKLTRKEFIAKIKLLREKAIANGLKLLDADEINEKVAKMRKNNTI
jgi:hypothetical protein